MVFKLWPILGIGALLLFSWTDCLSAEPEPQQGRDQMPSVRSNAKERRNARQKKNAEASTARGKASSTTEKGSNTPGAALRTFESAPVSIDLKEARAAAERSMELYQGLILPADSMGPWVIVHGLLGLGTSLQVKPEAGDSEATAALRWLAGGARFEGLPAFLRTPYGIRGSIYDESRMTIAPGALEGHPNQFLGYLSELGVSLSMPWLAWNPETHTWEQSTLADVLADAKSQAGINPVPGTIMEHTWTLWALANYEDPDVTWKNANGEVWSIARLIEFELQQGITEDTSCAGHHRLYALYVATVQYFKKHRSLPKNSVYEQAWAYIWKHASIAQQWQNEDGSFSAGDYLESRMATDLDDRLSSDGHALELLAGILPPDRLKETWFLRGVHAVATDLLEARSGALSAEAPSWGGIFHGIHALRVFLERTEAQSER